MQEAGNWKPYNDKAIVKNVELIFKTGDVEKLNKPTYTFVSLMSGFIAHYSLYGFQDYYKDLRDFANDLIMSCTEHEARRYETDSDFVKWYGQPYCSSKARAVKGIGDVARKYQDKVNTESESNDVEKLENLNGLVSEVLNRKDPELSKNLVDRLEL